MISSRLLRERGSVLVLVAAAIFPIIAVLAFAIDVSHWFDYSRNLQNRADAAALAGGVQYGNTCFTGSYGDPWVGLQSDIGKWAQLYSGPGTNEPFDGGTDPSANVPYSDASVSAATNVSPLGYLNVPNLTLGSLDDYFVRLNADDYADKGGTDFVMGDFCNADPSKDKTDKEPGPPGPMVDVKVTQKQLPNFIPIFNVHPNIEAHARVELQKLQVANNVRPIGVGDAADTPCITANFLDKDGSLIVSEKLVQQTDAKGNPTGIWDSSADSKAVAMPLSGDPVTVQLFLNNCVSGNPAGSKYDYFDSKGNEKTLGLVYIHNWGSPASPATAPEIASDGVTLIGSNGTLCDPYFQTSSGSCSVDVDAHVAFPTPAAGVTYYVRAVDAGAKTTCDPNSCDHVELTKASGTDWQSASSFTFGSDSGPHNIDIWTAQLGGSVGGKSCDTTADKQWATSNTNCWTELGVQQRAFSGIDGTNLCSVPAYGTGPLQWITIGETDATHHVTKTSGANAYGGSGTPPYLYVTTSLAGLSNAKPGDPEICLRVGESMSHDTGLIICPPQTSGGTTNDITSIVNGCDPLQIDTRVQPDGSLTCSPTISPQDCVTNDTGQSPPILKAFDDLICTNNNNPPNNWPDVSAADPRAVTMIITAPVDFTTQNGTTQNPTIPIRNFAVFYVTGWSTGQGGVTGCSNNTDPPLGAGNGELWGYWTSIAVNTGAGNGEVCDFTQFGNCVAVLTH